MIENDMTTGPNENYHDIFFIIILFKKLDR